jgi:hypothetical protein
MSTPTKAFGYCSHGDHGKCPVVIDVERTDNRGTYAKHFECGCECHRKNQTTEIGE